MQANKQERRPSKNMYMLSIIIPTYNESENIVHLLDRIKKNLFQKMFTEIIIVDDNSPDGTSNIVQNYIKQNPIKNSEKTLPYSMKIITRKIKNGLIPAILEGVKNSYGDYILIMDADLSHPPELIPKMTEKLLENPNSIVIASRYIKNGAIIGWPFKRKLISKGASKIARLGLNVNNVTDPMSGFFIVPRSILNQIQIDTKGYKILLEILVKSHNMSIQEIPYTFHDRTFGKSKMSSNVIFDYISSVWHLYKYGKKSRK